MKKKPSSHYSNIVNILIELKTLYPTYTAGRHLSTALSDYGDLWNVSDKEIEFALTKYKATMEMDVPHEVDEDDIQQIIEDGMNLHIPEEEDEY